MERDDTKNKKYFFLLSPGTNLNINLTLNCAPKIIVEKNILCIAIHRVVGYYDTQAKNLK